MHAMRELMHHNQLHGAERQPAARGGRRLQHQLDHHAAVEVAPDEFGVGGVFFEGGEGEVVRFHDRGADGGDAFEEGLG